MDRRRFLLSLGVAATAGGLSCSRKTVQVEDGGPDFREEDLTWGKAPCRYCGTGCGVEVGVKDGKVLALRGDQANPVNRGLLCVKGYHLPALLYGKDRLTKPQKRVADGKFVDISWDEALDTIAKRYRGVLSKHGPEAVAMYGSGQWTVFDGYAALKWLKGGMKSNNLEPNARLCMASAVVGFVTQFQSDEPMGCYEDFELADDFILWGNNMAETHPVLYSRILEHKRKHPTVRIYDLATRWTPTSEHADVHILFRPGSDLALANGILNVLVNKGMVHEAFVRENVIFKRGIEDASEIGYGCYGDNAKRYTFKDQARDSSFEELKTFLDQYTPEQVSKITGVSVDHIHQLASVYGDQDRGTVSLWCMGVNQHVRGTWMNNLITDLHLLTGKISRPGNNPLSLTGQPSACGTVREVGTLANRLPADMVVNNPEHRARAEKLWNLPPGTIPAKPGLHTMDLFRAWERGEVKAMWVQTTNPWVTLPNLGRFERKPDDGKFLVVSEIYPTETTQVADIILPSAAWVEREGIFGNTERRTQHWEKLVEPPGQAREDAWQIMEVARRMGMKHLFPYSEKTWHEEMYEEYRKFTLGTGKDLASYQQLQESRGLRWPVIDGKETLYRYSVEHDQYYRKHYVQEGKGKEEGVHFYKAKGYGQKAAFWLRPYNKPAEVPDKDYPFWLTTGRVLEHWHTGTMTGRTEQLQQARPRAYVEINRADADELGIASGDRVKLESKRGVMELVALIDGRGRPPRGTVFVPFYDESKLINQLTLDAMDCLSKEPDFKKCAVRIKKV